MAAFSHSTLQLPSLLPDLLVLQFSGCQSLGPLFSSILIPWWSHPVSWLKYHLYVKFISSVWTFPPVNLTSSCLPDISTNRQLKLDASKYELLDLFLAPPIQSLVFLISVNPTLNFWSPKWKLLGSLLTPHFSHSYPVHLSVNTVDATFKINPEFDHGNKTRAITCSPFPTQACALYRAVGTQLIVK